MKFLRYCFTLLFIALLWAIPAHAQETQAMLFTAPWCPHCQHLKADGFLEHFRQTNPDIKLYTFDVTDPSGSILFHEVTKAYATKTEGIPLLVVGNSVLQGYPTQIATGLEGALRQARENHETLRVAPPAEALSHAEHEQFFNQITLWTIIGAGLVDGINPCAFAVIVFFVSFLAAYKYNKKEIIVVGTAYCSAVFLAYVLMGLGVFHVLYALEGFRYAALIIQWGIIALCAVFFVLCVYDFIIYQKTKKSEKMLLQLSKNQKTFIHKVMRAFLKDKQSSLWRLLAAAFVVGFVVSGVEAVCTGQVYLPTIRVILKEANEYFFKAAAYLLIYNLMFIAPLVLVFILTLCGKESATFNTWLKNHLGLAKFLLCCVFLGLLILLIFF